MTRQVKTQIEIVNLSPTPSLAPLSPVLAGFLVGMVEKDLYGLVRKFIALLPVKTTQLLLGAAGSREFSST